MKKLSSLLLALATMPILQAQVVDVDLTGKDLFVREDGTGDGSSWEKAMGPQTFAYYLPQAKDGTTFHVAEGTYYPMYDAYMRSATGSYAVYTVNSDITIKGGYPSKPATGAKSEPSKYKAVFSGDFGKDDEFKLVTNDGNYALDVTNYEDNSSNLFLVRPSVQGNWTTSYSTPVFDEKDTKNYLHLEGVTLKGANGWLILAAGLNLELNLSYSTVENGAGIYMVPEHPTFIADNCKFNNLSSEIEFITPKEITVSNSVFNCCGTLAVMNLDENYTSKVNLDKSSFIKTVYANGTIEISGLCDLVAKNTSFSNMKMYSKLVWGNATNMEFYDCDVQNVRADFELFYTNKSAKFENCSFVNCESRIFLDFGASKTESFSINKCLFDSNEFSFSFFQPGMKASITNSTFLYNTCESYFMWNHSDSFTFANNSVLANSSKSQGFYIVNPNFYNNTILGNEFDGGLIEFGRYFDDEPSTTNMYGNIVLGNGTKLSEIGYENLPVIKSDKKNIYYNLMPIIRSDYQEEGAADNTTWMPDNKTNIFVRAFDLGDNASSLCKACASSYSVLESDVISQLYSGKYSNKSYLFDPYIDKTGILPVSRLKTPRLEDGTSLLFPLKNTIVTTDELGAARTVYTSMGAVERSCVSDTTFETRTIIAGHSFEGKKYTTIGTHDNIHVTKKNIYGCDSVINYTLRVIPDTTIREFYVKTKAEGKGDGSSWDNAMNPKDFAFVFANALTEGISYYVAEGKYNAVYNYQGKEVNDRTAVWKTNRGANIYGGYASSSTGNAKTTKADPSKYHTIFTGDLSGDDNVNATSECEYIIENLKDNMNSTMFTFIPSSDMHISGIELTGMTYSRGTSPSLIGISAEKGSSVNVTIDHCKFYVADKGISIYDVNNLFVDNCEFEYILNAAASSDCNTYVSNSTFSHTSGIAYYGKADEIDVHNCTFVNNHTNIGLNKSYDATGYSANVNNNTFISCTEGSSYFSILESVKASFVGNIFVGTKFFTSEDDSDAETQIFKNNLFAYSALSLPASAVEKDNIKLKSAADLFKEDVLDGQYTASSDVFVPNLATNGGFTRSVALLKDELSNGTAIRFARLENVTSDQRDVKRLPNTCMGAYELDDKAFVIDPTIKEYYVKISGSSDGDGTSWDNALDPETFAKILPLVGDDVVFHIAEGEYTPIYDSKGGVPKNTNDLCFTINSDVTIEGGYPAEPKKGAVSNPEKYKTIFTGDIKFDDKIATASTEAICLSLNFENRKDNATTLFMLNESATNVNFVGVTVKSATNGVVILGKQTLNASKSTFSHCATAIQNVGNRSIVNVTDSKFSYNLDACVNAPYADKVNVSFTSFSSNTSNLVFASDSAKVTLDSVSVFKNRAKFYLVSKSEIHVSRSRMYDNCDDYVIYLNSLTKAENTIKRSYFSNNSGKVITNYAEKLVVDTCDFIGNKGNSIELIGSGNANIAHSNFKNNKDIVVNGGSPVISASSFINNSCDNVLNVRSLKMSNSTITGNDVVTLIQQDLTGKELVLTNNTIVSNNASDKPLYANSSCKVYLYGNIILDNTASRALRDGRQFGQGTLSEFYNIGEVKYNLMDIVRKNPQTENTDMSTYVPDNNTNILVMPYEIANIDADDYLYCAACKMASNSPEYYLTTLFNGSYNNTSESFSPVVNSSDYLTALIPLKSDKGIRFPLSETTVTYDQRGANRLSNTCMGSYEMTCLSDTTFGVDTIIVGTKFNGVVYNKVGRLDRVLVAKPNKNGCDDIICYTLYVMPDPKVLNYYVKTKATGKGDGSDWDNAMDGTDFANYLPLVSDGVTFYVAEGTYNPVLNADLEESSYVSDRQYTVNSDVRISGGYPANSTGTKVSSNPAKYVTKFDGLIESKKVNALFFTKLVDDIKLTIDGSVLSNADYAVLAYNNLSTPNAAFDVDVDNVSFVNNSSYAILSYSDKGSVNVDHSSFGNNRSCIYSLHSSVSVNNSSFENNGTDFMISIMNDADTENNKCSLYIDSTSFVGNTGSIQTYNGMTIRNSEFDSNEVGGNLISAWTGNYTEFDVDLANCKFIGNKVGGNILETYSQSFATIDRCQFYDNECGYDMIKANYLTVDNSEALRNKASGAIFNSSYKSTFNSDAIENCVANDIVKYSSLGCEVVNCSINYNDAYLLSFTPNSEVENKKFELLNCEVIGNTKSNATPNTPAISAFCGTMGNDSVNVIKTVFRSNNYKDCSFLVNHGSYFTFDQCLADSNFVKEFVVSRFSQSHIYNSSCVNNDCDILLQVTHNGTHYSKGTGATYVNNTIVNNTCSNSLIDGYYSKSLYENNTIIGNSCAERLIMHFHSSDFIGNLVFGNTYDKLFSGIAPIKDEIVVSNIMPSYFSDGDGIGHVDQVISLPEGNIMSDFYYDVLSDNSEITNNVPSGTVNHLNDITDLFEGFYNANTGRFIPVLKSIDGSNPVVVLKKDVLADGTSIRFDRIDDVISDQIGKSRLEETCMGAYELGEVTEAEEIKVSEDENAIVNVYSVEGYTLKTNTKMSDALSTLKSGFYIIGDKKVYISK